MSLKTLTTENLSVTTTNHPKSNRTLENPLQYVPDLKVKLEFKLGEATLTIDELRHLKFGSTINLDIDQGLILDIYLNSHLIGNGNLVEVDGILGVKIANIISE
jgi:flagellar motor switch/type III secretory pathway protein FliN